MLLIIIDTIFLLCAVKHQMNYSMTNLEIDSIIKKPKTIVKNTPELLSDNSIFSTSDTLKNENINENIINLKKNENINIIN